MYEFIKVFGERNCGTNFLNQLCTSNFTNVQVLEHGTNSEPETRSRLFGEGNQQIILDRLIDSQRLKEFPTNFGWKHSSVTCDYLRRSERFARTMFLFIVRNPYTYLNSIFRRPYNLFPLQNASKSEFLRSPFIASQRDNLDDVFIKSPIDLWNRKTESYVKVASTISNSRLIRYEDLVTDVEGFVHWIHASGIQLSDTFTAPMASTKNDPLSFDDYREAVLRYDPSGDFITGDIEHIRSHLDAGLLSFLRYDMPIRFISPTWQERHSFATMPDKL